MPWTQGRYNFNFKKLETSVESRGISNLNELGQVCPSWKVNLTNQFSPMEKNGKKVSHNVAIYGSITTLSYRLKFCNQVWNNHIFLAWTNFLLKVDDKSKLAATAHLNKHYKHIITSFCCFHYRNIYMPLELYLQIFPYC